MGKSHIKYIFQYKQLKEYIICHNNISQYDFILFPTLKCWNIGSDGPIIKCKYPYSNLVKGKKSQGAIAWQPVFLSFFFASLVLSLAF